MLQNVVESVKKTDSELRVQLNHISDKQDKVLEDSNWRTSTKDGI
jgi:hypothetical protein